MLTQGFSRWIPTLSMLLVSLISYIDPNTLALLAPTILKETNLSAEQYGFIISGFSIAYMISNPVWGRLLIVLAILISSTAAQGRNFDVSGIGGIGVSGGEDEDTTLAAGLGASAGWPFGSKHKLQFDYLFTEIHRSLNNRHFLTGSYVTQARRGRTRPFFQIGAGAVVQTFPDVRTNPFFSVPTGKDASFAVLFAGGATIDAGRNLFIRPQVRLYGYVGPTLTVLPSVAVGWRF